MRGDGFLFSRDLSVSSGVAIRRAHGDGYQASSSLREARFKAFRPTLRAVRMALRCTYTLVSPGAVVSTPG